MSLAVVYTRAQLGIIAPLVRIEVHVTAGLPSFTIVGLPEKAVKESRERVRSALVYNQFNLAIGRVTVNLAPADLPKMGAHYDLAIAIGLLAAQGDLELKSLQTYEFFGEMGLTGDIQTVPHLLPMVASNQTHNRTIIIPNQNQDISQYLDKITLLSAGHILDVIHHLQGNATLDPVVNSKTSDTKKQETIDFSDVYQQRHAKRALEIAAAGGHSVLMQGAPGAGKSMLAERFKTILPPLQSKQALEVAMIHSISPTEQNTPQWTQRPFRSPHHTASHIAMVGGGTQVLPGEVSLAHHGILFLDELPEFPRLVLESLREPMESGTIHISRASRRVTYPAQFQLIAAMNPCPCGYLFDPNRACRCSPDRIIQYQSRISGPLLDRIDLRVSLARIQLEALVGKKKESETSQSIRHRVVHAQQNQYSRQQKLNVNLSAKECDILLTQSNLNESNLVASMAQFKLTARSFYRIIKVARTIADLKNKCHLDQEDIQESLAYRNHCHQQ